MAPLSFTQALLQAEAQARSTLDVALHERLSDAVALVTDGRVFQTSTGDWQVDSTSREGLTYSVNGTCTCDDVHYNRPPQGLCKHRIAVYLSRRAVQLMATRPDGLAATETAPVPEVVSRPYNLPEAPASANCHITIAGRQVQLTLRDTDETRLLERLAAVLAVHPVPQPAPQATSQPQEPLTPWQHNALAMGKQITGFCAVHNVPMKENHKDGRTWWSHKTPDGQWCKGK